MTQDDNSQPPKRVTMSTIAAVLGVTKTTVSLALRDHPSISAATKERVKDIADKFKYRPDPAISAIATQRWSNGSPDCHRVIAFLCHLDKNAKPNPKRTGPAIDSNQEYYLEAAKKRAYDLGYKLEPFFVNEYPSAQAISRVLYSRGIRGIIIPPIQNPESKRVLNLDWSKFTAVCCGIGRARPPLHTVTPDTFAHTCLVWNVLKNAGYKRIGAVLHRHTPVAHDDWLRIGASTAAMNILELNESAEIPIHTGEFEDSEAILQWYRRYRPEVVLAFNNRVGEILEAGGVRIPEDTQFVCLISPRDDKWSGIIHMYDEIAEKSMEILDSEIRHNHWGIPENPNVTLVLPKWNTGQTLKTAPLIEEGQLVSVIKRTEPELSPMGTMI